MVYETGNETVDDALERVLAGERLDRTDGLALIAQPVEALAEAGAAVRDHFGDGTVDACSIVNAKAGNCAEDCGFCAQSVHFDTGIDTYGFLGPEKIFEAAKRAERDGAQRFGIVVAEKGVSKEHRPEEWAAVLESIRLVRDECDLEVALVADESDRLEDRRPLFGAVFLRDALLGDHDPEALGTVAFGPFGRLEDLLGAEEAVGVDAGVEVDRLRTEAAILGAVARLRVDDRAGVDRAVAEVIAHGRAGLRERLDRLGDQRKPVGPVEALAGQHPLECVVDRLVSSLVNHNSRRG